MVLGFLHGIAATGCFVAGVLFLRFWRETFDRLFLWFAVAFWMLTANWTLIAVTTPADESRYYLYLLRLAGFAVILLAIIDKNINRPD